MAEDNVERREPEERLIEGWKEWKKWTRPVDDIIVRLSSIVEEGEEEGRRLAFFAVCEVSVSLCVSLCVCLRVRTAKGKTAAAEKAAVGRERRHDGDCDTATNQQTFDKV